MNVHLCSLCVCESGWVTLSGCTCSQASLEALLILNAVCVANTKDTMAFQASRKSLPSAEVLLGGGGIESFKDVKLHFEHM